MTINGRRIEVVADLTRVWALCEGRRVPITNGSGPNTRPSPTRTSCRGTDTAPGAAEAGAPDPATDVEVRYLADYDTALGLDDGGVVMAAAKTVSRDLAAEVAF
jgi:hypothetical protein